MTIRRLTLMHEVSLLLFIAFAICFLSGLKMYLNGLDLFRVDAKIPVDSRVKFVYSDDLLLATIRLIREQICTQDPGTGGGQLAAVCESKAGGGTAELLLSRRRLPGCLVLGAPASGITELTDVLALHPQIVTRSKQPYHINYFERGGAGIEWYRNQLPPSVPGQVTVDSSDEYFYGGNTPAAIHNMNRSLSLIVMVREPIQRAEAEFYLTTSPSNHDESFYNCAFNSTRETINDKCSAIRHSLYDVPMSRYLRFFEMKNILIVDYDQFQRNPYTVLQSIEDHIGITHAFSEPQFVLNPDDGRYCLAADLKSEVAVCRESKGLGVSEDHVPKAKLQTWFSNHTKRFFNITGVKFPWI